jgi:predicted DNA binding CopG/RHH family protein
MSSEKDRAAHYESHKDDPDEWGEAEPAPKERRRLASMVSVRLAPDELELVRTAASSRGLSVSAFLRSVALAEAQGGSSQTPASELPAQRSAPTVELTVLIGPNIDSDVETLGGTRSAVSI